MDNKANILAISGSTRSSSSNLNLIKAIAGLRPEAFTITIYEGLSDLPHFNPDMDTANLHPAVAEFRKRISQSDGVLICTPEYAMGVPGTLKNAIDWTVSSMEFSKKPTALITASLSGNMAHQSLSGTLQVIEAKVTDETHLLVPFVKTKISDAGEITDMKTLDEIEKLLTAFEYLIRNGKDQ
ncbi:MAG: hypothetical protein K0S09_426 [Sphingobacteriaceae bacterium]|jgi:NAD(P)H-dependent FMN reductase|nr:hypothetical protein [Sphingobacteriaceae bacterium]